MLTRSRAKKLRSNPTFLDLDQIHESLKKPKHFDSGLGDASTQVGETITRSAPSSAFLATPCSFEEEVTSSSMFEISAAKVNVRHSKKRFFSTMTGCDYFLQSNKKANCSVYHDLSHISMLTAPRTTRSKAANSPLFELAEVPSVPMFVETRSRRTEKLVELAPEPKVYTPKNDKEEMF